VKRYLTKEQTNLDGLKGTEGAFLACSFWLVDAYLLSGRKEEARTLFERLLALRNDVGLLSEEYDVQQQRLVDNFPQSFSHVALINSARNLCADLKPAEHRKNT
jgi:GH15 family glucan-1,4-alpha-glucosidase